MNVVNHSKPTTISGHISASYVNLLFEWLDSLDQPWAKDFPFRRPQIGERNRVSVAVWKEMLDWTVRQAGDVDLPFLLAERVKPSNMGLLGYIALCCSNLGEAFARLLQFEHLIYSVNDMRVDYGQDQVRLVWGQENGRPGHWVDSLAIAVLVAFTRQLTDKPVKPVSVAFINSKPSNMASFERFFGCPVTFNEPHTHVAFDQEVLGYATRAPDPVLQGILNQQADALLSNLHAHRSQSEIAFSQALNQAIVAGKPTLGEVARLLCVSERTLQRQLTERGSGFRQELQTSRINMAKKLLSEGELSLIDVAAYLAYNDQASFTHAFRRSTGQTPAQYRKLVVAKRH